MRIYISNQLEKTQCFPRLTLIRVKSKYTSAESRRMSGRKGRLNKRGVKCNRLRSFKDNTLAPPPCYEWLALNEAVREPGNYTAKRRRAKDFLFRPPFAHTFLSVISLLFYDFACIVLVGWGVTLRKYVTRVIRYR